MKPSLKEWQRLRTGETWYQRNALEAWRAFKYREKRAQCFAPFEEVDSDEKRAIAEVQVFAHDQGQGQVMIDRKAGVAFAVLHEYDSDYHDDSLPDSIDKGIGLHAFLRGDSDYLSVQGEARRKQERNKPSFEVRGEYDSSRDYWHKRGMSRGDAELKARECIARICEASEKSFYVVDWQAYVRTDCGWKAVDSAPDSISGIDETQDALEVAFDYGLADMIDKARAEALAYRLAEQFAGVES